MRFGWQNQCIRMLLQNHYVSFTKIIIIFFRYSTVFFNTTNVKIVQSSIIINFTWSILEYFVPIV